MPEHCPPVSSDATPDGTAEGFPAQSDVLTRSAHGTNSTWPPRSTCDLVTSARNESSYRNRAERGAAGGDSAGQVEGEDDQRGDAEEGGAGLGTRADRSGDGPGRARQARTGDSEGSQERAKGGGFAHGSVAAGEGCGEETDRNGSERFGEERGKDAEG